MKIDGVHSIKHVLSPGSADISLGELLGLLSNGRRIIGISVVAFATLALLYSITSKPVYESTVRVLIEVAGKQGNPTFLDLSGTGLSTKITNEIETLTSNTIVEGVAKALMQKKYLNDSTREVIPLIKDKIDTSGQAFSTDIQEVADRVAKSVEFNPIKESDIIKITASSNDPREAALLANTYTEVYADRNLQMSRSKSKAMREFLQLQLRGKHQSLDSAENALQGYMRRSGMVSLDGESRKIVDQLSQVEGTRNAIDVEIKSKSKTLASYKQELVQQEPNFAKVMGESNDTYIRLIQEQLAQVEAQRDMVLAQNPTDLKQDVTSDMLRTIDAQIATLKRNLQNRTQSFLKSLLPGEGNNANRDGTAGYLAQLKQKIVEQQIELDGLNARKAALDDVLRDYERQFNQIPEKSIELARLQRARQSDEKLYLLVEEKFNEAAITETSEFGYINILDPAVVPIHSRSPRPFLNLVLGIGGGLLCGVLIVVVRAVLDNRLRSPEDVRGLGYLVLSIIGRRPGEETSAVGAPEDANKNGLGKQLVVVHFPYSPAAESYRHLLTSIQFAEVDRTLRFISVTSPNPGEGKSTTVANLAIVYAETGKKVLLVDGDLRKPSIHSIFGMKKDPGLVDILMGKSRLEGTIRQGILENLDILPSGTIPRNSAALLGSKGLLTVFQQLGKMYDTIFFDSAPLLAVTDAVILASKVDGVIIVVSGGETRNPDLTHATELLSGLGDKVLGVVLNNFDIRKTYRGSYAAGNGYYGHATEYYLQSEDQQKG